MIRVTDLSRVDKDVIRRAWDCGWKVCGLFVLWLFTATGAIQAHGELLIRIAAVTRQIGVETNNPHLYLQRGELYREDQNWAAASSDYDRASKLDPNLAVDFYRAKMLADSGQLEAARSMFGKVIGESPKDGEALVGRARVLMKLQHRKAAIADFQQGLKLHMEPQPEYFLECAQALFAEGEGEQALHTLDDGIKKFGPIVQLQRYAIELDLEQKSYDSALVRLETIIGLATRKEDWLAQRGEILLLANRSQEAQKSFKAALRAIDLLPRRLQQGPAMLKLQSRIQSGMKNSHATSTIAND